MNKIQMVDLLGQYQKINEEIDKAIQEVISSTAFINGPQVKTFEKNLSLYTGAANCIGCANGTDALQIAMMALDLKPGDEVIVPAFTYIATVETAALLGLKLVLADVEEDSFNLSPQAVEKAISPKTKAIVPVHLFGQCTDMDPIMALAQKYNLYVIEDVAQALGACYTSGDGSQKSAGTIGHIGTTSFFPSKNLGCYGDGGALFTNDENLALKIKMIANHGQEKKYYHDIIGINSRLDTLQAAILDVKLKKLDQYVQNRQYAAAYYDQALKNHDQIVVPARAKNSTHVFHQYTIQLRSSNREKFKEYLESKNIPSMVYYPVPVHFQKAYVSLGYKKGDFPISEKLSESVISLPMHTELSEEQLAYITENILNYFK